MRNRVALIWGIAVLQLATILTAKAAEGELLSRIPAEFQGRWVMKLDQCEAPTEGYLDIWAQKLNFREGRGNIVSAHRIGDLKLEVNVNLTVGNGENWRQVRRYSLSRDMHTLTESRSDNSKIVRVRCARTDYE